LPLIARQVNFALSVAGQRCSKEYLRIGFQICSVS
jgi:hypothetical protein